ncbi:DEAD/DEAH box helicase, partial [Acinetobacter baumannii]
WAQNKSDTLKYLVVDELHTFDGAQGSDLAMLIRRLKAHLKTPKNHLVTVGTSATIGSEESKGDLLDFVSKIFDAEFTADSIIGETRVSPAEFQAPIEYYSISYDFDPKLLNQQQFESEEEYLKHQAWFFFGKAADGGFDLDPSDMQSRQELGLKLKSHAFFL